MPLKPLPTWTWPATVAVLLLVLTAWLWNHERDSQDRNLRASFDYGLRQTATRIEARMGSYEQMLRGLRGLFDSSDDVTRADFSHYVQSLSTGADYAGLRGMAYAPLQPQPGGEPRAPLTYLEPAQGPGMRAVGEDMLALAPLQRALALSREAGTVALSPPLRGEATAAAGGPAFLLVLALYRGDQPLDSARQRQQNAVGWVMASFHVNDLMSSLYGEDLPGLEVKLYDGLEPTDEACIYATPPVPGASLHAPRLQAHEYLSVGGHTWTLVVRSTPAFEARYRGDSAQVIVASGVGLALLAAMLTWQLVTARDRAHAAAELMTRQLSDSAERYRRIVDTANEGIWMVDAAGLTGFANPRLLSLLGRSEAELMGQPWHGWLDASCAPVWFNEMAGVLRGGQPVQRDLCFRRADGTLLWATVSMSPVLGEGGAYAGALAMVTDISARRQAEAQQAALEQQLLQSQKMEAIGTLAGGIAHDFNNITAAILGNLALGRAALTPEQATSARLDSIQIAAERGRSLVQQIAAFSRRQAPERSRQALKPLLDEAVTLLRTTLPARVDLQWACSDDSLVVQADATQLQQVLMNLCTNAWHALHERPGQVQIALDPHELDDTAAMAWALPTGRYARIRVRDNGCGMDEATRSRVFEPFFTTKPVGQGTGLGLSVVHGIVVAHGGAIRVHSTPGQGSTFDILLPLSAPGGDSTGTHRLRTGPTPRGRGELVLVVDDDAVVLAMVDGLLTQLGYRVLSMGNPHQALERAVQAEDPVDAVVSDFNMPALSGVDLAAAIHAQRPQLPVLLSSGYVTEELRAEARHAGVRQVMQKEYTLDQLGPMLHRALNTGNLE